MARGTQERFAKWAHLGQGITKPAVEAPHNYDNDACKACTRRLGDHSTEQLFACGRQQRLAKAVLP